MNKPGQTRWIMRFAAVGVAVVAVILIASTWFTGQSAKQATEDAVRSVSMFYLDELAGRREQVVATKLKTSIADLQTAVELMTADDLSDVEHLQEYQARMKKLYGLEKFAFVDENGLIYTSLGTQDNIADYDFDYQALTNPKTFVKDQGDGDKKVIIAVPVEGLSLEGKALKVCFMEIDMDRMLEDLSLKSDNNNVTFCNIYTRDGVALTDMILGGLASEDNLLDAMSHAQFKNGDSLDKIINDFKERRSSTVSFTYNGIQETLDYVPVEGTDWMLTYLIRESVISDQISDISDGIVSRNVTQTILTVLVLFAIFAVAIVQTRRRTQLAMENEQREAENRVKQEEMQQRIELQEKLLEQEKQRARQDKMITALASDYRSVFYVDLDADEGVCYQADPEIAAGMGTGDTPGERFGFHEAFEQYASKHVVEQYQAGFLDFIKPKSIRAGLAEQPIITFRYLIKRNGHESYEMLRMAGVRHAEDRDDGIVHAVGVGFTDVDNETRDQMAQSRALSDALAAAEEANKAKTTFLSNMSHEIRTPMNAIIGLDSIALGEPGVPDKTREHLEMIGDSARHLLGLINDVLDVSRIEAGRMSINAERFSFSRLIEQVNTIIGGQCNDKGLEYHCRLDGQVDDYYIGDDVKLRQALINVLGNAVKFTPAGGSVDFGVKRAAQFDGRSTLRFTIRDTGVGMDAEFIPHLFDTFTQEDEATTNSYGSTGLGMAITKNIVEMMNGDINVVSAKGEGTTFTITVTLLDSDSPTSVSEYDGGLPENLNVLVVDDDPLACEHARVVLEEVGIAVQTVLSGAEAIEAVRLRHARREPFNLILIDWKMPEMDGVETSRQIRAIAGKESAIIILTAYNWDDVLEEALGSGVDSFIAKPLFATSVLEEFTQALQKRAEKDGLVQHRAKLEGRHMLIAEDMDINAEILQQILKTREISSERAENGRIALDMFSSSEPGHYDAILMDVRMPEMDGLAATEAIRALNRPDAQSIPVIALTANAFDEDVQKSLQAGLNAHLSKPVEPDNLFETLESLIRD